MPSERDKDHWRKRVAKLRQRAREGDVKAAWELGLDLLEGIQDKHGGSVLRRNSRLGFRFLMQAARGGDSQADFMVGCAYDMGLGTRMNKREALRWYRRAAREGVSIAASNLATVYRSWHKYRLAFQWWKRSATMGDGDSAVDVGYCCQYGIGTRRNVPSARRFFRRAVSSRHISAYGREEGMYHLAVSYLDAGMVRHARPLLARAAKDGDYPEAANVLAQLRTRAPLTPCRCRRFWRAWIPGQAPCPAHPRAV